MDSLIASSSGGHVLLCVRAPGEANSFLPVAGSGTNLQVRYATNLAAARDILNNTTVGAILAHLPLPDCSAEDLLVHLQATTSRVPIVLYEPSGCVSRTIELTARGAFQYIGYPVQPEALQKLLLLAIRHCGTNYIPAPDRRKQPNLMVGSSDAMRDVAELIQLVSSRRSTVLITGETGTGKEIAARAIHLASNRSASKMVAINCAALPEHLLEAELFGHTKGAFTGAINARTGLFEQASRSTIFLDEIGEMPLPLQAKLLRVLQEREIQRIGSSETIPVDVRVIAASNIDLQRAIAEHRFREDLYYRLNVVGLKMPALRERPSDIAELAEHFLNKIAEHDQTGPKQLSSSALEVLMRYSWPGNVRQLEHALESAVALSGSRMMLVPDDFDLSPGMDSAAMTLSALDVPEAGMNFDAFMNYVERRLLESALVKSGGNKARAASMLQMKRTTLISKFKSLEVCV